MAQHLKCNTTLEGTILLNKKIIALVTAFTLSVGAYVTINAQAATHTVQAGESLWSIAQKYDVQTDKIKNNNHLESDSIFPNQQLNIPSNEQGNNIYVVQPGDSLYDISQEHGVPVDQLVELNGINTPNLIYPGDTIAVDGSSATGKQVSTQKEVATQPVAADNTITLTMTATAYTAYCEGCSGITKNGTDLRANPDLKVIAVDPSIIPLGTRVWVEGYGEAIAADTGGAIKGNKIDVFMPSKKQAYAWGRKKVTIKVYKG